jgi:hypothetical protein
MDNSVAPQDVNAKSADIVPAALFPHFCGNLAKKMTPDATLLLPNEHLESSRRFQ